MPQKPKSSTSSGTRGYRTNYAKPPRANPPPRITSSESLQNAIRRSLATVGNRIFRVKFIKADGTIRLMNARLHVTKGVSNLQNRTGTGSPKPDNVVTVYEMPEGRFRSFRIDRVLELTITSN